MIQALSNGAKNHRQTLADYERPVALQSSVIANSNRDPKKQKNPYTVMDFMIYKDQDDGSLPISIYGSAALALVSQGRFPHWALFCFKELKEAADPGYKPGLCAFITEDAILLHPQRVAEGWTGMLIARETASNQTRVFVGDDGQTHRLTVPLFGDKYYALEGAILT